MRSILILITSLILLIQARGQDQWEIVDPGIDLPHFETFGGGTIQIKDLLDVQFIDRDIGFIGAGACGIHFSGGGALIKTEDGGRTWNLIYSENTSFSSILFINDSNGFVKTQGSNCYPGSLTTSDGGYSWVKDTTMEDVSNIFFMSYSTGWAARNHSIFKTINGGGYWDEEYELEYDAQINSLFFVNDSTGWAVGENGLIIKYNENKRWLRLRLITDLPLSKLFFVDCDHGWISGGFINDDGLRTVFMRTVNGGENWSQDTEMEYLINDFYFDTKNHGWAIGEDVWQVGVILETFNGGINWDVVTNTYHPLNAIYFVDGYGWAVGNKGQILKYEPTAAGIKENNEINGGNQPLFHNFPNPFRSHTIITYCLSQFTNIELCIYDLSGRRITTLVNEKKPSGNHEVEWSAPGMEAGIYFCQLRTGLGRQVIKMVLTE